MKKLAIQNALSGIKSENYPMLIATAFIFAILILGTVYTLIVAGNAPLLSPQYLLQQLQTGAFLGICAAGVMMVILLGHIDLSIPWTLTTAAMMATTVGGDLAIPTGLAVGIAVGLFNGLGVSFLRVPSMIFTLGVDSVLRGLMVFHTGGYAPQTEATPLMRFMASGKVLGVPIAVFVWALISFVIVVILNRTGFGRSIYATGASEKAAFLSGVRTHLITIGAFICTGLCSATAGVLLAGYATRAYQGMGSAFLLPAIAAVVLGGTHILGGRGRYLGTLVGVVLIVLLNSVLSIMQIPEGVRQITYGSVIIIMLLVYGRNEKVIS